MIRLLRIGALTLVLGLLTKTSTSQITLSGTSYTENFDNIAAGLPTGILIKTGATAGGLGTDAALTTTATAWSNTSGRYSQYASADGLTAASTSTEQGASTDRALGIRQTGSFGDPGGSFVINLANTIGFQDFTMNVKLQSLDAASPRTTTWVIDYAIGSNPNTFTTLTTNPTTLTTGGSSFTNTSVSVNFGTALNNLNQPVWIRISALTGSTGSGSRATSAIDDVVLNYTAAATDATAPLVTSLTPANGATNHSTNLPLTMVFDENMKKGTGSITINNITDATQQVIDVTTSAVTITGNSVVINAAFVANKQYAAVIPAGVLLDLAGNSFAGITAGNWNFQTVGITTYTFNFDNCTPFSMPGSGWTQFSVAGDSVWNCTAFGNANTNAAQMNGYVNPTGPADNEDWLISPALNLTAFNIPILSFKERTKFAGPALQILVSTNYTGTGNPAAATWTVLNAVLPAANSDAWTLVDDINLAAYKTAATYIAFKYTSSPVAGAPRTTLDDVNVRNSAVAPSPSVIVTPALINFDFVINGGVSVPRSFEFTALNLAADLTITAPASFQLSKDNTTFSNSLTYTTADVSGNKTAYVRYTPTAANIASTGKIQFATTGYNHQLISLAGNSYPKNTTLEVVNWNIEWFGGTQGPSDDNLQQQNVKRVLDSLNADVYGFSEVVDTLRLANLVSTMPGYAYKVSDYASSAPTATSSNYPTGQKLAFVYRTDLVKNVTVRGLLRSSATANTNWASGRFPFLMEADVVNGAGTARYHFILIHGKAGDAASDYQRRKDAATELKDTMDAQFNTAKVILLGDYNDDLDSTITSGIVPALSSYDVIVKDSTDADHYKALSLPISLAGMNSTTTHSDVVDHVVVSNEVFADYIPGSARLVTEVESYITNYGSTTTDHYAIMSRYLLPSAVLGITPVSAAALELVVLPNPVKTQLTFVLKPKAGKLSYQLIDMQGKIILASVNETVSATKTTRTLPVQALPAGTYFLKIFNNNQLIVEKIVKQ